MKCTYDGRSPFTDASEAGKNRVMSTGVDHCIRPQEPCPVHQESRETLVEKEMVQVFLANVQCCVVVPA